MKPISYFSHLLSIAGSFVLAISSAYSQTNLFWDQDGASTTATGGTGTWNTTSTWRSDSSTGTLGDWTDGNIAVFGGTAGTVTLSGPVSAAGLTFSTTGYTITGSTLTLTGIPVISAAVTTSTISSDIAGTNGLEKTGAGTLILSGTNNTYSGTTTISAGTLQGRVTTTSLTPVSPFGSSSIQLNGGSLQVLADSNGSNTAETITIGNNITVGGNATVSVGRIGGSASNKTIALGNLSLGSNTLDLTIGNIGYTMSFTGANLTGNAVFNGLTTTATTNIGAITETGGPRNITKSGGNTLRLLGTNTYTGTTTISGGTLEVQGSIASSSGIINDATLTFNSASAQSYGNVISGSGNLTKAGTGTLTLSGDNTFTGSVTVTGTGTLVLSGTNSYTGATNIGNTATGGGTLSVNSVSDYGVASAIGAATATNGVITLTGNKSATSTFIYTGTGGSMNREFRIGLSSDSTGKDGLTGVINNDGSGALILTASTFNVLGSPYARTLSLGGTYSGSANEIQGVIQNTASATTALTKTGASIWKLSGANTYTGATTVQQGNLIAGASSLVSTDGAFGNAASEIALGVASGSNAAGILIGGAFTIGRDIRNVTADTTDNGTRVLTLGGNTAHNSEFSGSIFLGTSGRTSKGIQLTAAANGQVTFSGVIQETGGTRVVGETTAATALDSVTKVGAGTVILTNANTYLGKTVVSEGTLLVNNTTGSGTGSNTVTVATTGTLGGSGAIAGATTVNGNLNPGNSPGVLSFNTSLALATTTTTTMEIDGTTRGTGYDGVNIGTTLALDGNLVLDIGMVFTSSTTFNLFNVTGSTTGDFDNVSLQGAMGTGSFTFAASDVWSRSDGNNTWTFTESTGVLSLAVIPEPSVALLSALGVLLLFRRRR